MADRSLRRPQHRAGSARGRRFFRSGELHLVLLALLAERPQHGYELIKELGQRFGPAYNPSPGSIYPALSSLEAEHLVEVRRDGDRKIFHVTEAGRSALEERSATLAAVEARTGSTMTAGALEPALLRLVARVRAVASALDAEDVGRILDAAGDEIEAVAVRHATERHVGQEER